MSSFNGTAFLVLGDGGQFPTPEIDDEGTVRYAATIRIPSVADRTALSGLVSIVTPKRIYGLVSSIQHIEGGPGAKTLVVPTAAGTLTSRSAILVALTGIRADARQAQAFTADAEWILL